MTLRCFNLLDSRCQKETAGSMWLNLQKTFCLKFKASVGVLKDYFLPWFAPCCMLNLKRKAHNTSQRVCQHNSKEECTCRADILLCNSPLWDSLCQVRSQLQSSQHLYYKNIKGTSRPLTLNQGQSPNKLWENRRVYNLPKIYHALLEFLTPTV